MRIHVHLPGYRNTETDLLRLNVASLELVNMPIFLSRPSTFPSPPRRVVEGGLGPGRIISPSCRVLTLSRVPA